jgi:DNA-binding IscR family transcriptional regulator
VINIAHQIADAFENNEAPISQELICSKLDIPGQFGEKILAHLVNKGLIARTSEPRIGFIPVKEPRDIKLSDIADAVAAAAFAQGAADQSQKLWKISHAQHDLLAQSSLADILVPAERTEPQKD